MVKNIPCANFWKLERLFEFLLQKEQEKNSNNG